MKFLLELPIVLAVAEWIWADAGDNATPEHCLDTLPLMPAACWNRLLAKAVGVAIIAGACLNKAPVIYNIWTSQSTAGLSAGALYGELAVVANNSFYCVLQKYPFTAYGESVALLFQGVVLILLQWRFAAVSVTEMYVAIAVAILYIVAILYLLPIDWYSLLMASMWPLQVYAKGAQIYESWRVQHTGAQAIITILMNVVGSGLRIGTTLAEVGWDFAYLTGAFLSVALNGILMMQYFVYRENTQRFLQSLETKKKAE